MSKKTWWVFGRGLGWEKLCSINFDLVSQVRNSNFPLSHMLPLAPRILCLCITGLLSAFGWGTIFASLDAVGHLQKLQALQITTSSFSYTDCKQLALYIRKCSALQCLDVSDFGEDRATRLVPLLELDAPLGLVRRLKVDDLGFNWRQGTGCLAEFCLQLHDDDDADLYIAEPPLWSLRRFPSRLRITSVSQVFVSS